MRTTRIMVAALIVGGGLALHMTQAQQPRIGRTEASGTISATPDAQTFNIAAGLRTFATWSNRPLHVARQRPP
jgi:hypothetical protein